MMLIIFTSFVACFIFCLLNVKIFTIKNFQACVSASQKLFVKCGIYMFSKPRIFESVPFSYHFRNYGRSEEEISASQYLLQY